MHDPANKPLTPEAEAALGKLLLDLRDAIAAREEETPDA